MDREFNLAYINEKINEYRKRLSGISLETVIRETEKEAAAIPKPKENPFGIENPMNVYTRLKGLKIFLEWEKRFKELLRLEDLTDKEISMLCHKDLPKIDGATYFSALNISYCLIEKENLKK